MGANEIERQQKFYPCFHNKLHEFRIGWNDVTKRMRVWSLG